MVNLLCLSAAGNPGKSCIDPLAPGARRRPVPSRSSGGDAVVFGRMFERKVNRAGSSWRLCSSRRLHSKGRSPQE